MIIRWQVLGVTCLLYFIVHGDTLDESSNQVVNNTSVEENAFENAVPESDLTVNDEEADSAPSERVRRRPDIADISKIDASTLGDSVNEEREARCSLGSKRRLYKADNAEKVAHYFMNGGPTLGHAYFVGNSPYCNTPAQENSARSSENDGSGIVGAANPTSPYAVPMQLTPIYTIPGPLPYAPSAYHPTSQNFYNPITGITNPLAEHTVDNTVPNGLLGSILQPHNLARTTGNLLQGLVGIPSMVHNWVTQNLSGYAPENVSESNGNYEKVGSETPMTPNPEENARYSEGRASPKNIHYNSRSSANAQDNILGSSLSRGLKSSSRSRDRLSQRRKEPPPTPQYTHPYIPMLGLANPQPTGYIILPHNPYFASSYNMVGAPYQPPCQTNDKNQLVGMEKPSTERKSESAPSDETDTDKKKDNPVIEAPKNETQLEKSLTDKKNKDTNCKEKP